MKSEKIKYILLIMLIGITVVMPQVYAKTSIEIKPNSSTVYINKTISEFFDESMAMKNVGEGLEGSDVDVHMATNKDWAIFAYFSNSQYGTNGEGQNTGLDVTIGNKTYKSTNGNITGMMDLGKTWTYTPGIISGYAEMEKTSDAYLWGKRIVENATNNKYVDIIDSKSNRDRIETALIDSTVQMYDNINAPYSYRNGLFKGCVGCIHHYFSCDGAASTIMTFRPAIWN